MAIDIAAFLENADKWDDEIPPNPGLTPVSFGKYRGEPLQSLPEDCVAYCIHPQRLIETERHDWYHRFLRLHQEYEDWRVQYDAYDPARVVLWFIQNAGNGFSIIHERDGSLWWHRLHSAEENTWASYYRIEELAELCRKIDVRNARFRATHSAEEVEAAMARIQAATATHVPDGGSMRRARGAVAIDLPHPVNPHRIRTPM